jgi:hypothetical protein
MKAGAVFEVSLSVRLGGSAAQASHVVEPTLIRNPLRERWRFGRRLRVRAD